MAWLQGGLSCVKTEAHAKIGVSSRYAELASCSAVAACKLYLEEVLCCASKGGYPSEYASPEALRDTVNLFLYQVKGIDWSKALHMAHYSVLTSP